MIFYDVICNHPDPDTRIVWAHGWGHSSENMRMLASAFSATAENVLLDFPGFGKSPAPDGHWGTADYADAAVDLIKVLKPVKRTLWVGHSFGCRVGIQVAALHPGVVDGMALIAAAGLKPKREPIAHVRYLTRIWTYKITRRLFDLLGLNPGPLRAKFGSPDYQSAGPLRAIFVNVVNEDLSDAARQITCPVTLVFGADDTETPVEMGKRLSHLIPGAKLVVLDRQDHYSLLADGRYPVIKAITSQLEALP